MHTVWKHDWIKHYASCSKYPHDIEHIPKSENTSNDVVLKSEEITNDDRTVSSQDIKSENVLEDFVINPASVIVPCTVVKSEFYQNFES